MYVDISMNSLPVSDDPEDIHAYNTDSELWYQHPVSAKTRALKIIRYSSDH